MVRGQEVRKEVFGARQPLSTVVPEVLKKAGMDRVLKAWETGDINEDNVLKMQKTTNIPGIWQKSSKCFRELEKLSVSHLKKEVSRPQGMEKRQSKD
ncbi:hypothetical protein AXG93_1154s1940 [Marchantia polymorpha subsp. ruderalis]|uniref:Uncharacterized protein n=1 Tax=Marchantia polymorpha subsp. ruderalis TaxID=1480154 RepID=A0A176WRI4_MARPO|nr:hypothetical protein AXG93_1154s1940 [Marchantia polymorpha subsp. ruderalis]